MKPTIETGSVPKLSGVLETSIYVDNLDAAERFYGGTLGLPKIFAVPGRQLVFRCQESILLVFNPQHTERERIVIGGGAVPLHGSRGAGHVAFRVAEQDLEAWRQHFGDAGLAIESEITWPNAARSIYFRDPAGNSLELVTPSIWQDSMTHAGMP